MPGPIGRAAKIASLGKNVAKAGRGGLLAKLLGGIGLRGLAGATPGIGQMLLLALLIPEALDLIKEVGGVSPGARQADLQKNQLQSQENATLLQLTAQRRREARQNLRDTGRNIVNTKLAERALTEQRSSDDLRLLQSLLLSKADPTKALLAGAVQNSPNASIFERMGIA